MLGKQGSDRKVTTPVFFTAIDGANSAGAAADYSMTVRDRFVHVYESNGLVQAAYAITLPAVADSIGLVFAFTTVEDLSSYNVTIQDQDESFDWADILLTSNNESLVLQSDGRRWHILSANVASLRYKQLITTYQVLRGDHNKTFLLNLAAGFTVTLPTVANAGPGFRCRFIVKTAPSGGDYVITEETGSDTNVIITNGIRELAVTTATHGVSGTGETTITFADGVAIAGDWIELFCDGTNWYAHGVTNATVAITIA